MPLVPATDLRTGNTRQAVQRQCCPTAPRGSPRLCGVVLPSPISRAISAGAGGRTSTHLAGSHRGRSPCRVRTTRDGAQALLVLSSPLFVPYRERLAALAIQYRLPAIYILKHYVEAGGLM